MNPTYLLLEIKRDFRNPRFAIFTVVMPVVLFLVFGEASTGSLGGVSSKAYTMVSMAAYGSMAGVISSAGRIAIERGLGWNRQLRLTPMSGRSYVRTKVVASMAVGLPSIVMVCLTAAVTAHVRLSALQWVEVVGFCWLALLPFAAIGIAIGYLVTGDSVQAISMPVFLLLSLLGGLWIPVEVMPKVMASMATWTPSYWLALAGRTPISHGHFGAEGVLVLAAWVAAFALFAGRRYQRDTARA